MKKVVVFDCGVGGELFADYLEEELSVIDVIRVIDWRNAPYNAKSAVEICALSEAAVRPYIGRVDVIVLANFEATMWALAKLQTKYPEQCFVGMNLRFLLRDQVAKRVLVLTTGTVSGSKMFREARWKMWRKRMTIKKCEDWAKLIDEGEMDAGKIEAELREYKEKKFDTVWLGCTHFRDVKPNIRKVCRNWKIEDGFRATFEDVYTALGWDVVRRKH